MPHGDAPGVISEATATALNSLWPFTYYANKQFVPHYGVVDKRTYDSSPKCYPLRAGAHGKRDILDIGAGYIFTGVGENACTDAEFGIWACFRLVLVYLGRGAVVLCIMGSSCDLQYAVDLAEMALSERISSSWVVMVLAMFVSMDSTS